MIIEWRVTMRTVRTLWLFLLSVALALSCSAATDMAYLKMVVVSNVIGAISGGDCGLSTNEVIDVVSSQHFKGYGYPFTDWQVVWETNGVTYPTMPEYDGTKWSVSFTNIESGAEVETASKSGDEDAVSLDFFNGTVVFSRTGTEVYTNDLGLATLSNLTQYVKHTALDRKLKSYVSQEQLENCDTSYMMVEGISTENQTIQLVVNTNRTVDPLNIEIPRNGGCKDWIVYVLSATNMTINLPSADYWVSSESVTNDLAGGTPTAFYFSQVSTNGIYTMSRKELIPISVQSIRATKTVKDAMTEILQSKKKTRRVLR